jgi:hypothetical protein
MKTVVCDAGPIIHLHEAGLLALQKLRRTSLWLSSQICQEAREAILEMTPNS